MAGSATSNRPGAIIEGINVTPLVDIMLVLLVIFIVTAKILVTPAVPLELPKAAHAGEMQVIFAVTLPARGPAQVNGVALGGGDAELGARAAAARAKDPDLRAVIQADGDVPHRRVMETLDALRGAGVFKVAFAVAPKAGAVSPAPAPSAP